MSRLEYFLQPSAKGEYIISPSPIVLLSLVRIILFVFPNIICLLYNTLYTSTFQVIPTSLTPLFCFLLLVLSIISNLLRWFYKRIPARRDYDKERSQGILKSSDVTDAQHPLSEVPVAGAQTPSSSSTPPLNKKKDGDNNNNNNSKSDDPLGSSSTSKAPLTRVRLSFFHRA